MCEIELTFSAGHRKSRYGLTYLKMTSLTNLWNFFERFQPAEMVWGIGTSFVRFTVTLCVPFDLRPSLKTCKSTRLQVCASVSRCFTYFEKIPCIHNRSRGIFVTMSVRSRTRYTRFIVKTLPMCTFRREEYETAKLSIEIFLV